nr:hypothetical protein [Fodinicola feengrottensis]
MQRRVQIAAGQRDGVQWRHGEQVGQGFVAVRARAESDRLPPQVRAFRYGRRWGGECALTRADLDGALGGQPSHRVLDGDWRDPQPRHEGAYGRQPLARLRRGECDAHRADNGGLSVIVIHDGEG